MIRRKIKLIMSCLLVSLLIGNVLAGCSSESNGRATAEAKSDEDAKSPVTDTIPSATVESPAAKVPTAEPPTTAETTPAKTVVTPTADKVYEIPEIQIEDNVIPDSKSFVFVKNLKIGWNLGNTFDAFDCTWLSNELDYESGWCRVKTTEGMIKTVKDAGFNTIRIPVTWHNHISGEEHQISKAWLNRVQEVVDYAIGNDMFVIINIHHDMSEEYIYPSNKYLDQSTHYIKQIWSQIAERFIDYNEHLIFESMNEPRMVGSKYEWWIDAKDKSCKEAISCINTLNQVFVDTVRVTGGNNADRYLMVPGYDASYYGALDSGFKLPGDTVPDKLIVSVHAYIPYDFALQDGGIDHFDSDNKNSVKEIDYFITELYNKFVSKGTPVVIGEFGARNKKNNLQDRIDYATYYIAAARARGIPCLWWDNNAFSGDGELFGLLDRSTQRWKYPEIVEGLMKYVQ